MSDTTNETATPTEVRARVRTWRCPYCESYAAAEEADLRAHVTDSDDEAHAGVDGDRLDRHVPGFDEEDALVAVLPAAGTSDRPVLGIEAVDSLPGTTRVRSDAGSSELGVDAWECPYCETYRNASEQGIRSHVTGSDDEVHAGRSGWNPDRPISGYDADGNLVARITAVRSPGDRSVVVPAGEAATGAAAAFSSGEGVRGEKKIRLVNAWLVAPDAHYAELARVAGTTERYAHRVKGKLESGEIPEETVETVADDDLRRRFQRAFSDDADAETGTEADSGGDGSTNEPGAADRDGPDPAATGDDTGGAAPGTGTPDDAAVAATEVQRVRDMLDMYRREAEFETETARDDAVMAARAETKRFVAGQAIEMLEELLEESEHGES